MEPILRFTERIPGLGDIERISFALDIRESRGEAIPPRRITVELVNGSKYSGLPVESVQDESPFMIALRLDASSNGVVFIRMSDVIAFTLDDIAVSGHYFFDSLAPRGPAPGPIEIRTAAKDSKERYSRLFGRGKRVKLPDLPALKPSQAAVLAQCVIDLYWTIDTICGDATAKETLDSGIEEIEFRTAAEEGTPPRVSVSGGNLVMESSWTACRASAKGRATLREEIESLF